MREFEVNEEVWVRDPLKKKYSKGRIITRNGILSYIVFLEGKNCRKHADHLRKVNYSNKGTENLKLNLIHYPNKELEKVVPRRSKRLAGNTKTYNNEELIEYEIEGELCNLWIRRLS